MQAFFLNMKHIYKTKNGKLSDKDLQELLKDISQYKEVSIKVSKYYKKRSDAQNRYWWGVLVPYSAKGLYDIGNEWAKDNKKVHNYLGKLFLTTTIEILTNEGEVVEQEIVRSTTELNTFEFSLIKDEIQMWASEFLGIYIPDPNEQVLVDAQSIYNLYKNLEPNKLYDKKSIKFVNHQDGFDILVKNNFLIKKGNAYIKNTDI